MSGVKDPFEILADEITLIRRQIDQLQRTSLDRKEAEKLNAVVAQGLDRMAKVGPAVQTRIEQSLATAALDLRQHTVYAGFPDFPTHKNRAITRRVGYLIQFSRRRLRTRANSSVLSVTRIAPEERA